MNDSTAPTWLTDQQVATRYSVSRMSVWRWVQQGRLPKPRKLSPGCTRWNASELDAHDAQLMEGAQ